MGTRSTRRVAAVIPHLARCRRLLLAADRRPTEVQRRLAVYGVLLDVAGGRLRVTLLDGWYRERRVRDIGETRAILLRAVRTERPAVWLPWSALLDGDPSAPDVEELVTSIAQLLARLAAAGNTGLVRYSHDNPNFSKIQDLRRHCLT